MPEIQAAVSTVCPWSLFMYLGLLWSTWLSMEPNPGQLHPLPACPWSLNPAAIKLV